MTKIILDYSFAHFGKNTKNKVKHGPQVWAWWHVLSLSFIATEPVSPPSKGYRLWVYTRWGALHFDVYFDRREGV